MEAKTCFLAFFALFLVFSSSAQGALDITKTLSPFPELSTFNELLTKTQLVGQINKLNAVTVLAFDNAAAASIAGKPIDVVKKIVSNHIVLDYFDLQKLTERVMEKKSAQLTTMFQSSGEAENNAGFLNASLVDEGETVFGSGVKGSPLNAKLVNETVTQPYTISVFQITEPIIAPGIDQSSSPADAKDDASSPADAKDDASPPADAKDASSPADGKESDAKSPTSEESPKETTPDGELAGAKAAAKESSASSLAQAFGLAVAAVFISSMLAL